MFEKCNKAILIISIIIINKNTWFFIVYKAINSKETRDHSICVWGAVGGVFQCLYPQMALIEKRLGTTDE